MEKDFSIEICGKYFIFRLPSELGTTELDSGQGTLCCGFVAHVLVCTCRRRWMVESTNYKTLSKWQAAVLRDYVTPDLMFCN